MRVVSALMVARILTRDHSLPVLGNESIPFGSVWWFIYAGISCLLVLFAGIMSGLTLGLMSLGLVDLEILERSGSPAEKAQAGTSSFLCPFSLNLRIPLLYVNHCARGCMYVCICSCYTSRGEKTTPASCHSASL